MKKMKNEKESKDIEKRKGAKEEQLQQTKYLAVLAGLSLKINPLLIEENIYDAACHVLHSEFGMSMCWWGIIKSGETYPIAGTGIEENDTEKIKIIWGLSCNRPADDALRTREPVLINNLAKDTRYLSWNKAVLRSGYVSAIVLPVFSSEEEITSLLSLFSAEPEYFTPKKIDVFRIFANQIQAVIEIRNLIDGLSQTVRQRTAELTGANTHLLELDRLKSMFIASTSHELRTPLNSIIGFSSVLLEGWSGKLSPEQKEQIEIVHSSAKHLLVLITDVIDLSKIEAGKIDVRISEFGLRQVVDEAIQTFAPDIKAKGLDVSADTGNITMVSDRKRLFQCILNLLGNAVKFTEKGGIKVTARIIKNKVDISITDTGIGIKKEDIPKLFGAFVRLESPLSAEASGTGLGLYLTRKLARDILGGDVDVISEYGKGSTFTLHIPVELEGKT